MNKILLIIQREYITRVRKKTFLITTFLLPLLMFGFVFLMGFIISKSGKSTKIAVVDESGLFNKTTIQNDEKNVFTFFDRSELETKKAKYLDEGFDMLLYARTMKENKPDSIIVYSESTISLDASSMLDDKINQVYQNKLLVDAGFSRAEIDSIDNVKLKITPVSKDKKGGSSEVAAGIGYAMGLLIYIIMLIYGTMVMRGVMEEKTNRIAEVIVSSVKPFQLMMGKIIGIALVGLTQFILWMLFGVLISFVAQFFIHTDMKATMDTMQAMNQNPLLQQPKQNTEIALLFKNLSGINWAQIAFCFLFYFVGGYLLYASLFAAVGSLVNEDVSEAQQFTLPITMPIIAGMFIMIQAMKDPNSSIAVFGSMFPLTSPIVMMARVGYGVPTSQLVISMLLLIVGFVFTTWLSGKIYRTGILMYGKKPTWREIIRWISKS